MYIYEAEATLIHSLKPPDDINLKNWRHTDHSALSGETHDTSSNCKTIYLFFKFHMAIPH